MADKSLPLDPEPQYMLIVAHQQAKRRSQKCHDSSKANLKDQNWAVAQLLEISTPSTR